MLDLQNFNFEVKPIIIDKFQFLYLDRLSFPGMKLFEYLKYSHYIQVQKD